MLARVFKLTNPHNISLFFIGLMFLLPFVILRHEQPIPSFFPEWVAGAMGFLASFALFSTKDWYSSKALGEVTLKIPQISLVFVGLTAIVCLQWALGMLHSNQYALLIFSYYIWAFLLVVLASNLRHTIGLEKLVSTLAWCLLVAGIINIGLAVLQFVVLTGGVIPFIPNLGGFGAIAQANHFANFCALATASLIYLYAKGHFSLSMFRLLLVCFIVLLSVSGSRSVWLYLTAMTILITMMRMNIVKAGDGDERLRGAWHAGLLLVPIFIVVQLFINYLVPNELVALSSERLINSVNEQSASVRLQFWHDSIRIFLLHPWLGVGAEKFRVATFLLADSPTALTSKYVFEHAHNLFLHLLAEMGIGAFLIICAGLWVWLNAFKWQKLNLETWWIISLLAVLGIHSMLEYPLWYAFFLGIAAILLGAGDERLITFNLSTRLSNPFRLSLFLVLILGLINLSTMLIAEIKLESWIQKVVYENTNDQRLLDWAKKSSSLSPYAERLSVMTLGNVYNHDTDEEVLQHQSVMNFKPEEMVAYQLALLLELQGQHAKAIEQLHKSLSAYPEGFDRTLNTTPEKYKKIYLDLQLETQSNIGK